MLHTHTGDRSDEKFENDVLLVALRSPKNSKPKAAEPEVMKSELYCCTCIFLKPSVDLNNMRLTVCTTCKHKQVCDSSVPESYQSWMQPSLLGNQLQTWDCPPATCTSEKPHAIAGYTHTLHFTIHTVHFTLSHFTPHTSLYTLTALHFSHFILFETLLHFHVAHAHLPLVLNFRFCTALLLPALPKAHSDAEGFCFWIFPNHIMLATLKFLILFVQP